MMENKRGIHSEIGRAKEEDRWSKQKAFTDHISDRDIYIKGIDRSYSYEGYENYRAREQV